MLQVLQLEVHVCSCKPAVVRGIIEDGFSYVGPNPFFGDNDFFGDIHKAFLGSEFKVQSSGVRDFAMAEHRTANFLRMVSLRSIFY